MFQIRCGSRTARNSLYGQRPGGILKISKSTPPPFERAVPESNDIGYLGLDVMMRGADIFLIRTTYISDKLTSSAIAPKAIRSTTPTSSGEMKTVCERTMGSLLWVLQARPDASRRICILSSSIADAVRNGGNYTKWAKRATKLAECLKNM